VVFGLIEIHLNSPTGFTSLTEEKEKAQKIVPSANDENEGTLVNKKKIKEKNPETASQQTTTTTVESSSVVVPSSVDTTTSNSPIVSNTSPSTSPEDSQ